MRSLLFSGLAGLVACNLSPAPPATTTPDPTNTVTTTTLPTNGGQTTTGTGRDYGAMTLLRSKTGLGPANVELLGLFTVSDLSPSNLARCAIRGTDCITAWPSAEDTWIDLQENPFDPTITDYTYVGTEVAMGEYRAALVNTDFPYYFESLTDQLGESDLSGRFPLTLGGNWYVEDDKVEVNPALNVMSHDAGATYNFHDGEQVVIEWEPTGQGQMVLIVSSGMFTNRLFHLEDDGYYELEVDDLMLGYEEVDVHFNLARWNTQELGINGNTLTFNSVSEVHWDAEYFYVGGRTPLYPVDSCAAAKTMVEGVSGNYWGRLADRGFSDDYSPDCADGFPPTGEEGFVKYVLPPKSSLNVVHDLLGEDSAVYVTADCDVEDQCLVGADAVVNQGAESVFYFNGSDVTETVYLGLDGWRNTNGIFYADIAVSTLAEPDMHDTCADALVQTPPTPAGGYYTDTVAYTNQLDPVGACMPQSSPGNDAMTKVELQAGETLTALVTMTGENPSLYLLYNCTSASSCAAGSDVDSGPSETVQYTNSSAGTETLYLVVDSKTALQPWFMTIDIQ